MKKIIFLSVMLVSLAMANVYCKGEAPKTTLSDEKVKQHLVGKWRLNFDAEDERFSDTHTYAFKKDGSYTLSVLALPRKKESRILVKGKWVLKDGVLTLSPTETHKDLGMLHGCVMAYRIVKISKQTLEWQIDYDNSGEGTGGMLRSIEIYKYIRVKK